MKYLFFSKDDDKPGRMIQNHFKNSLGRNFKFLRRAYKRLFEEEQTAITQNTPYIDTYGKLIFSDIYHIS